MIEVHDPSIGEGVAIYAECPFCCCQYEMGHLIQAPIKLETEAEIHDALMTFMRSEGGKEIEEFCNANLNGLSFSEAKQGLLNKESLMSNLDVMGFLFSGMHGGVDGVALEEVPLPEQEALTIESDFRISMSTSEISVISCALTSVMLADGIIQPEEERLLSQLLSQFNVPPLDKEDYRVWRPSELSRPLDPDRLIEAMIDIAFIDNELDGTEWQVIREYARYWRCDLEVLEKLRKEREKRPSTLSKLFSALNQLFFEESQ